VGRDFAIMGIDNLEIGSISRISLTSIDQPYDCIIELATRSMIESIESNQPCSVHKRLKPSLIVRESTKLKGSPARRI
jgi:DNA-binding LacI/PurR family transcriptional regulator